MSSIRLNRRAALALLAATAGLLGANPVGAQTAATQPALAQDYPNKPIRFVVGSPAGGVVTPTPEQFRDFTRGELERWRKMSDEFGIKAEQ